MKHQQPEPFVDMHCHLLPGLDDGPVTWGQSVAMAEAAVAAGIRTVVATPHQLGAYADSQASAIRSQAARLQELLLARGIPLEVLPGAEVCVEPDLAARILSGQVLTLADRYRHVLVEMPPAIFLPLGRLLDDLAAAGMVGVLAHPERNAGALAKPALLESLVDEGCLVQVTAASVTGLLGPRVRSFVESLVRQGLVHFIATDSHQPGERLSAMQRAWQRIARLAGDDVAGQLCCRNPARAAAGEPVLQGRQQPVRSSRRRWLGRRKVA